MNIQTINSFVFDRNIASNIGNHVGSSGVVRITADECLSAVIKDNEVTNIGNTTKTKRTYGFHLRVATATSGNLAKTTVCGNSIRGVKSNSTEDTCGIMVLGGQAIIQANHIEDVISSNASSSDNEGIYIKCQNSVISDNTLKRLWRE